MEFYNLTVQASFRISEDLNDKIEKISIEHGITKSKLQRQMLLDGFSHVSNTIDKKRDDISLIDALKCQGTPLNWKK